jgi:hypothetical protein
VNSKLGWDLLLLLLLNHIRVSEAPIPTEYWVAVAISIIESDWGLDKYE